MECIIANQITRLSLTFNLLAVSFPPANSCLFKWRPAQPPQPWRSTVKVHLIFHKWVNREYLFFLLFSLQDEAMFYLKSYSQISIVNLDATVKRSRSLKTSVDSCWTETCKWIFTSARRETECHSSRVQQMRRVSLGCNWIVLGLLWVSTRSSSNSGSCGQRDLFHEEM